VLFRRKPSVPGVAEAVISADTARADEHADAAKTLDPVAKKIEEAIASDEKRIEEQNGQKVLADEDDQGVADLLTGRGL
jgi:hypothetical protein